MDLIIDLLKTITQDADGKGLHIHLLIFGGVIVWAVMTFFNRRQRDSIRGDRNVLAQSTNYTDKKFEEIKNLLTEHDKNNTEDFRKVIKRIDNLSENINTFMRNDAAVVAEHATRITNNEQDIRELERKIGYHPPRYNPREGQ